MNQTGILKRIKSENYRIDYVIQVQLVVIHYTGGSWGRVKELFEKTDGLSSHFVIDIDGSIDEVIDALNQAPRRARHAGAGTYKIGDKVCDDINSNSIGIELVNYNGNMYRFSDAQYEALSWLLKRLIKLYPVLNSPERIIGHEDFAYHRGKCDPGIRFDWHRLYSSLYPMSTGASRVNAFQGSIRQYFETEVAPLIEQNKENYTDDFWHEINHLMETMIKASYLLKKKSID